MAAEKTPDALRARFRELTRQKEELEARIEAVVARLNAPGGPGVSAPLVDREGFPRADVGDLAAARRDRHDLACWTNDHKALMREVESVVHALMAAAGGGDKMEEDGAAAPAPAPAPAPAVAAAPAADAANANGSGSGAEALPPFASVGDVAPCSPAAAAGMQVGDLVLRLAGVDASSSGRQGEGEGEAAPPPLERVAAALAAGEGRPCACLVLRAGRRVTLELTPRRWAGRGLLGCHLRPLALPPGGA